MIRHLIGLIMSGWVCAASGSVVSLDFEDGTIETFVNGTYMGVPVASHYASSGVIFSNATWALDPGPVTPAGISIIALGNAGVGRHEPAPGMEANNPYHWLVGTPVVGVFDRSVTSVTIEVMSIGPNGFRVDAYDAVQGGVLLGNATFSQATDVLPPPKLLTVDGQTNIRRIEMYQPFNVAGFTDGASIGSIQYALTSPIPEPTAGFLYVAGLALVWLAGRYRRGLTGQGSP